MEELGAIPKCKIKYTSKCVNNMYVADYIYIPIRNQNFHEK